MIATMEKMVCEPTPASGVYPAVTYEPLSKLISATIVVAYDSVEDTLVVQAPIIALPKGGDSVIWTLTWTVLHDDTLQSASFTSASQGIEIPAQNTVMPPGFSVLTSEPLPTEDPQPPNQWQVRFFNGAASATAFSYTIYATGATGSANGPSPAKQLSTQHDPTIVVTLDPMT